MKRSVILTTAFLLMPMSHVAAQRGLQNLGARPSSNPARGDIPVQFRGKWAPTLRECKENVIREGGKVIDVMPSETAITITAKGFSGFEDGGTVVRSLPASAGSYAVQIRTIPVPDVRIEKWTLRLAGQRLSLRRESSGQGYTETYVRCR